MTPSYIVESTITCDEPNPDPMVLNPRSGMAEFWRLNPEFGFAITVWSPDRPDIVQEIRWNTAEQRAQDRDMVGRIIERRATERERADGEEQHSRSGDMP
jgi:hypothetical protein